MENFENNITKFKEWLDDLAVINQDEFNLLIKIKKMFNTLIIDKENIQ